MVAVYLHDILICSSMRKELLQHLTTVFEILTKKDWNINLKKCKFFKDRLVYFHFIVSKGDFYMDLEKVKVIFYWPTLHKTTEVRNFRNIFKGSSLGISVQSSMLITLYIRAHRFQWSGGMHHILEQLKRKIIGGTNISTTKF
jgi:hypothetical protein